jgi:hypothetical protein
MPEMLNNDDRFDEEWLVVMSNGSEYVLSKNQARLLLHEIAAGNRGIIAFETFVISIPYIVEFYQAMKFPKGTRELPARANEQLYRLKKGGEK